jgi:SAM-dependent methyltransferase
MMREMLWTLRYAARSLYRWIFLSRKSLTAWWRFWNSYRRYKQLAPLHEQPLLKYLYPCLGDDTEQTPIEPIYFYQDAWAFEKIVKQHPAFHVDVGSHHKFVALLSKVVKVIEVDIRPWSLSLDTLEFIRGSVLTLPFKDASVPSLSSLCVIEHIGLGRYGDPLDPYGSEKAIQELKRVVQPGGDLYISIPLDDENRIYFNAHRAFREEYLIMLFEPFQVIESRYIYNRTFGEQRKPGFGIGCYHLRRLR